MRAAEDHARRLAGLALASVTAGVVGFTALCTGGYYPYGTAKAAERQWLYAAVLIGCLLAAVLAVRAYRLRRVVGPTVAALAGAAATVPLFVLPAWALGHPLSTPEADSFGCGLVFDPARLSVPPSQADPVAESCRARLRQQAVLAAAAAAPGVLVMGTSIVMLVRPRTEPRVASSSQGTADL
jgi:hypothetical protein